MTPQASSTNGSIHDDLASRHRCQAATGTMAGSGLAARPGTLDLPAVKLPRLFFAIVGRGQLLIRPVLNFFSRIDTMSIQSTRLAHLRQVVRMGMIGIASLAAFSGVAAGQGSNYAAASYIYGVGPSDDATIPGCGSSGVSQSSVNYICGPVGVGGGGLYFSSGSASAVGGQLRITTYGAGVLPGMGGATSYASSYWTDQASVTPLGPGSSATQLQIALHVTGSLYGSGADVSGYQGSSAVAGFRMPSGNSFVTYQWVNGPGASVQTSSVDQVMIFTLALQNGSSSLFQYGISAFTVIMNSGNDLTNPTMTGSAHADFGNTVNPLWYHVLDASNNDVTSNYNVQFAQGLTFGPETPTTTPEPAALTMLGTGLLGLVPVYRCRSRIRS